MIIKITKEMSENERMAAENSNNQYLLNFITSQIEAIKDYIVETETKTVNGITWTYEKWNSGKAVCRCKVSTPDTADPASVFSKELTLPFEFVDTNYLVYCTTYQRIGVGANAFQYFRKQTTACWIGTNMASMEVNVEVVGRWK